MPLKLLEVIGSNDPIFVAREPLARCVLAPDENHCDVIPEHEGPVLLGEPLCGKTTESRAAAVRR